MRFFDSSKVRLLFLNSQFISLIFMFRKFFSTILLIMILIGCESDNTRIRNPFVPNYPFNITINMELPMYNALLYPSNAVFISPSLGAGTNGVIVFNTGFSYVAYEANCPNQTITSCSRLEISEPRAICPCDNLEYSLFTGLPVTEGQYTMIPYRVEQNGNSLRVWN